MGESVEAALVILRFSSIFCCFMRCFRVATFFRLFKLAASQFISIFQIVLIPERGVVRLPDQIGCNPTII